MQITLMRRLDYYLGVPLCLFLTLFYRLKALLVKKPLGGTPRKILFIKLWGVGSIVLTHPAVKLAAHTFPDSVLYFLTFQSNRAILELLGAVPQENIFTIRSHHLRGFLSDFCQVLRALRRRRIDVVIDMEFFSRFTSILSALIGSRLRVGFYNYHAEGLYRGNFLTHKVYYNHYRHTSILFNSLVEAIKNDTVDPPLLKKVVPLPKGELPRVASAPEAVGRLWSKLKQESPRVTEYQSRLIVLNVNAGDLITLRKWPRAHYIDLANALLGRKYFVVFIGSPEEKRYVDPLVGGIKDPHVINMAGKTSLAELIDLFNISRALITNDSGPAHIAALTGIKTITLFGPETPELYAALSREHTALYKGLECSPCVTVYNGKYTNCTNNVCLQMISVSEVLEILDKVLASAPHARAAGECASEASAGSPPPPMRRAARYDL